MARPRQNLPKPVARIKTGNRSLDAFTRIWIELKKAAVHLYEDGYNVEVRGCYFPFAYNVDDVDSDGDVEDDHVRISISERPTEPKLKSFVLE